MYPACTNAGNLLNLNGVTQTRYNEVGLVENGDEVFIMAALTIDGKQETSAPCVTNEAAYVLANLKKGGRGKVNTENKGKPIGKILLIFFLVLALQESEFCFRVL